MTAHTPSIRYGKQDVDGINIFYREAGSTTSPAVLLMHGFPSSSHMFRGLIPPLARHFHVIAPDLPGFGFSDAPSRVTLCLYLRSFDRCDGTLYRSHRPRPLCALYLRLWCSRWSSTGAPSSRTDHGHRVPKRERVRGRSQRRLESDSAVLGRAHSRKPQGLENLSLARRNQVAIHAGHG